MPRAPTTLGARRCVTRRDVIRFQLPEGYATAAILDIYVDVVWIFPLSDQFVL